MTHVIKLIIMADGQPSVFDGEYVTDFDPDFMDGLGMVKSTPDISKAKPFKDLAAVMAFWKTQSTVKPTRPDGRPNRPLTAFTIEPVLLV